VTPIGYAGLEQQVQRQASLAPETHPIELIHGHLHLLEGVRIELDGETLRVAGRRESRAIPVETLLTVHVDAPEMELSARLVSALTDLGVTVLLTRPGHVEPLVVTQVSSERPDVVLAQAHASTSERGARIARALLESKLYNQASLLQYYGKYRRKIGDPTAERLEEPAQQIRALGDKISNVVLPTWPESRGTLLGLEGKAAALYWRGVESLVAPVYTSFRREGRGATDPMNQSLNYLYGCLYAIVWRGLAGAGLDPALGVLHATRKGRPNLALDAVEELRAPYGDRVLLSLIGRGFRPAQTPEGHLVPQTRRTLLRAFHRLAQRPVPLRGKSLALHALASNQATMLASCFKNDTPYEGYHLRW
jgi:CRISPR-associated protein Cas1